MPAARKQNNEARPLAGTVRESHCPTGLLVITANGAILASSACFQGYTGYTATELTGLDIGRFFGPKERERVLNSLSDGLQQEYCSRISVRKKQGRPEYCFVSGLSWAVHETRLLVLAVTTTRLEKTLEAALQKNRRELEQAILDRDREIREFTSSLIETNVDLRREIREHHLATELLRQSEARFRNLTETTSDFIWEINREWLYTYASPKIRKLLGYRSDELLGRPFLMLQDPEMADQFHRKVEQESDIVQGFSSWHYRCRHNDGRILVIESSGEPIIAAKGAVVGFRGIDRDITERISYENRLRHAKEQAESADRAKSEFLANMSHELRTPLHAILSFARHGAKKFSISSPDDLLKYFLQIESSANRLLPLINSLLDLAKLEARKMEYTILHDSILPEIEAAIAEITHLAEQKSVRIALDRLNGDTMVFFDRASLANIIRNLLSNALKFCSSHSVISISFAAAGDYHGRPMLQTTVANSGVAIPDDELETIFDKFVQSSRTRTGAGGTGLGLAICRQIMVDLQGRIWAENSPDGRTCFHFTLPVASNPEIPVPSLPGTGPDTNDNHYDR